MARPFNTLISLFLLFLSTPSQAHVKWFVESEGIYAQARFTPDTISLLVASGALAFLLLAVLLEFNPSAHLQRALHNNWIKKDYMYPVLQASVLILLIGNIIQGHFIAPNFPIDHHAKTEHLAQGALILLLVFSGELFALATVALCGALFIIYGLDITIDYVFELLAIAIAVGLCAPSRFFSGLSKWDLNTRREIALTALRLGLGIQLCVLTFHDKLLHPGLALQFLADYPHFNFMRLAGINSFTDVHFVLGAGLAEFCFGLLLITNIGQRLASALICFFFTLSGVILGPEELLGHIPIFVVAVILLLNPAPRLGLRERALLPVSSASH
jgi:hypothetical protein